MRNKKKSFFNYVTLRKVNGQDHVFNIFTNDLHTINF